MIEIIINFIPEKDYVKYSGLIRLLACDRASMQLAWSHITFDNMAGNFTTI